MMKNAKDIHILYVEDDVGNQMVIKLLLQKMGYTKISVVGNSIEAVKFLTNPDSDIDVILMDLGLPAPGVNGIELAKQIRKSQWQAKSVPIIALTGNSEVEAKQKSSSAGMNDFLTKPVDAEKLQLVLQNIFSQN